MLSADELSGILNPIGDNKDNLRLLKSQLKTPLGVIPFVGAGLSIPFGFPTWGSFLLTQAAKCSIEISIQGRLAAGEYEEAAEDLLVARGYRAFHDAIANTFGAYKLEQIELSGSVTYLPSLARGPVITTNFDRVLEVVFEKTNRAFDAFVWGAKADLITQALHQNRRFLLKLHGDAEDNTDRVLTRQDYVRNYGKGSVDGSGVDMSLPLPKLLHLMLVGRPLLFLGCSLMQDRTVMVLERVAQQFRSIVHYAVVECPRDGQMVPERARFLSDHNIRPIWYPRGRHDLIEPLIYHLAAESHASGPPPSPTAELDDPGVKSTYPIRIKRYQRRSMRSTNDPST